MTTAQQRARHQEQVEELCAASVRAMTGETDLHFRGQRLHRRRRPLPLYAPHLHPALDAADFVSFRGAADGLALRLSLSDAALHQRLCPRDPVERLVFELLEQYRVEAMVPDDLPGARRNLRHCFETWSLSFHDAGLTDTVRGKLLYTVAQVCRSRVTGEPVVEATEDLIEGSRGDLAPLIGSALAGLRRARADQGRYGALALEIAHVVGELLRSYGEQAGQSRAGGDSLEQAAFALLAEEQGQETERFASAVSGRSRVLDDDDGVYRVFTRAYDRVQPVQALVRQELRREYRRQLDARVQEKGVNVARLARELRQMLAHPATEGWDGGQEEGQIDGRRLAQLVAAPTERRLFQVERTQPQVDCVVSFLIDCSGSMKEHIESMAVLLDVFTHALELAGASSEILGFTTGAWNGGRAQRDWIRAGRPADPGRLNERSHIVFKDADTGWRRARADIAGLLKADLFREGLDGEAVLWAAERLGARSESRKLLVVVSDGSPMDSATNLANDRHYLDHHLRDVVQRIEAQRQIGIAGLGVGLDLSPYYSRSHVLDLGETSANRLLREIALLMLGPSRR